MSEMEIRKALESEFREVERTKDFITAEKKAREISLAHEHLGNNRSAEEWKEIAHIMASHAFMERPSPRGVISPPWQR